MVSEDIITVLKNAVEHGDTLENAINMTINSGYNPKDVQEAANFVGGTIYSLQPKPGERLAMPSEKRVFSNPLPRTSGNNLIKGAVSTNHPNNLSSAPITYSSPSLSQTSTNQTQQSQSLQKQLNSLKPRKSYLREIILLIILLILVGILVASIIFREQLLNFLSGI